MTIFLLAAPLSSLEPMLSEEDREAANRLATGINWQHWLVERIRFNFLGGKCLFETVLFI